MINSNLRKGWLLNTGNVLGNLTITDPAIIQFNGELPFGSALNDTYSLSVRHGHRVLALDEKGTRTGYRMLQGPVRNYINAASAMRTRFGGGIVVNLLTDASPDALGLLSSETPFLGALVGPGARIFIVRPQSSALSNQDLAPSWGRYLSCGAAPLAKISIANGLIRKNAALDFVQNLQRMYRQTNVLYRRRLSNFVRRQPALMERVARAYVLRQILPSWREMWVNLAPTEVADRFEAAAAKLAEEKSRSVWSSESLNGIPSHDATAQAEAKKQVRAQERERALALLANWKSTNYSDVAAGIKTRVVNSFTVSSESASFPSVLLDALSEDSQQDAIKRLREAYAAEVANLLKEAGEATASAAALKGRIGAAEAELSATMKEIETLKTQLWSLSSAYTANENRREILNRWAARHLTFAPIWIDVYEVGSTYLAPGAKKATPIWAAAEEKPETTPAASAPAEVYLEYRTWGEFCASAHLHDLFKKEPLAVVSSEELPNLATLPKLSFEMLDAPEIRVTQKLSVNYVGSSEAYMMADANIRAYSPAQGRLTSLQRAYLERPTLIAQGSEYVQEQLERFGYRVEFTPEVLNRLGRLKQLSEQNQIPLRPIEPFEAPAYYRFGKMRAVATLNDPEGNPVWIAGNEYQITPGWTRRSQIVSEEEFSREISNLADPRRTTERVELRYSVTFWDVATESGSVRIFENEIREERELRIAALMFPEQANSAIRQGLIENQERDSTVDSTTNLAVAAGGTAMYTDEEIALLQSVLAAISEASAARNPTAAPKQTPEWPAWQPFLDEFVEVFPVELPQCIQVARGEELKQRMTKVLRRFGPRFAVPVDGSLPAIPPDVEDEAFKLFCEEQRKTEAAQTHELVMAR